jgi:hypothetical protein
MRDSVNPFALKWTLSHTNTDDQDIVVLTARMMGVGGPEYLAHQLFSEHEQMLFTKAVSVAESFGKHISLLVVPAGDVFAALVQTANLLEVSALVSGLSSKMTAADQATMSARRGRRCPNQSGNSPSMSSCPAVKRGPSTLALMLPPCRERTYNWFTASGLTSGATPAWNTCTIPIS